MPVTTTDKVGELVGTEIGVSDWIDVTQDAINQFADVTHDHQFIHVDPEAAAKTPFGGPIAHGFLTLSLLSAMGAGTAVRFENVAMGVNYGFEKVRFMQPVPAGGKVRGRFVLKDVKERQPKQYQLTYEVTVEIEGIEKPALIAEWLTLQFVQ